MPFKFGYGKQFNSLVLIYARKQKQEFYPVYKVQFAMRWGRLPATDTVFKVFDDVDYYFDEGYYKYVLGNCKTPEECKDILLKIRDLGYQDAFIVKFTKNEKFPLEIDF